jgi:hypothetical protein
MVQLKAIIRSPRGRYRNAFPVFSKNSIQMRLLITLTALLFLSAQVQAQITIERSDFTLEVGAQTKAWHVNYDNASIPEDGAGVVWDFSGLTLGSSFLVNYDAPSNPAFPQANITEPSFGTILGDLAVLPSVSYSLLDDTGYGALGLTNEEIHVPLGTITGGASDTLTVLGKVIEYTERRTLLQFPLNYGDTWNYHLDFGLDFAVTFAAFGLQGVPAQQISRDSAILTVAGYGTLILPNPGGEELEPVSIEALMVKRNDRVTNNYTLGGQPAPQAMLNLFGLEQGESRTSTRYFFYTKGLPRTAANINLNGNGEIDFFTISDDIKNLVSSTSKVAAEPVPVRVFPNPASGSFQLAFDKPDAQDWTVELHNSLGQVVHRQAIAGGAGAIHETVLLPKCSAGLYHYVLRSRAGGIMATGSVVLK